MKILPTKNLDQGESLFDENEDENLEKRSYLNNARYLSKAVHQGVCGNCYLHTCKYRVRYFWGRYQIVINEKRGSILLSLLIG